MIVTDENREQAIENILSQEIERMEFDDLIDFAREKKGEFFEAQSNQELTDYLVEYELEEE